MNPDDFANIAAFVPYIIEVHAPVPLDLPRADTGCCWRNA